MMLKRSLLWIAMFVTVSAFPQTPAAGQEQQKKQINDPAEYNAYVAALNEAAPAKKLQMLDEFLAKYPNTVVKEDALELKMVALQQAGQSPEPAARQLLQVNPNNLRALILLSYLFPQTPLSPTDPALEKKLTDAEQHARRGLENLPSFQPPNVSGADLEKAKKAAEATFRQSLGVVARGRKQFEVAQTEFRKAAELSPEDGALFYRLGDAFISERPDPKYTQAFWAFARAATLDGSAALPPAGRQQVDAYLRKVYVQFHGEESEEHRKLFHNSEDGLEQLKKMAKAQPFPPADFKVRSRAELAASLPADPQKLRFDEMRDLLRKKDTKADELWGKLNGMSLKLQGLVVSTTPATRPRTVRLAVLQETAQKPDSYDVELTLARPSARPIPAMKVVQFEGLVNSFKPDPFVLTMVDGKVSGGEEAPAAKKTPAGRKTTRKRR